MCYHASNLRSKNEIYFKPISVNPKDFTGCITFVHN